MKKNLATYIVLAALIVISIFGFLSMSELNKSNVAVGDNPGTFPQLVCCMIIIFSVVSIIQTIRTKETKVELGSLKLVIATVVASLIFIVLWSQFDIFYIISPIFVFALFWMYSKDKKDYKRLVKVGIPVAIGTILCIYLFFEKAMALIL